MKEFIDVDTQNKLMAMILCGVRYDKNEYLIYAIGRDKEDANIFLSKLVKNSNGYATSYDFLNGEKEVLEKMVTKFLNKESVSSLENEGFFMFKDVSLEDSNEFDIKSCYVTTISKSYIKDCLLFYDLYKQDDLKNPVVLVKDEKVINAGFVGNLFLIVLGIGILVFCIGVIIKFVF